MKQVTRYLPLLLLAVAWELAARLELVSTTALPPLSDVTAAWIDMVKDGELNIEDIPTRTSEWPFLSNVTIDLAYTVRKVRVEPQISEGTPTQYPQAIDWNSYLLLEW